MTAAARKASILFSTVNLFNCERNPTALGIFGGKCSVSDSDNVWRAKVLRNSIKCTLLCYTLSSSTGFGA